MYIGLVEAVSTMKECLEVCLVMPGCTDQDFRVSALPGFRVIGLQAGGEKMLVRKILAKENLRSCDSVQS